MKRIVTSLFALFTALVAVHTKAYASLDYITFQTKFVPGCSDYSHGWQSSQTAHSFTSSEGCLQIVAKVHRSGGGCVNGSQLGCKLVIRRVDNGYDPDFAATPCRANPWLDGTFAEQSSGTANNQTGITMNWGGCDVNNDTYYYTIGSDNGNSIPPGRYTVEVRAYDYSDNTSMSSWDYANCIKVSDGGLYYFTVGTVGVYREILVADTKYGSGNTEYYFDKALQPGNDNVSAWTITGSGTGGSLCAGDDFLIGFELNTYKNIDRSPVGDVYTPHFRFWVDTPGTDVGSSGSYKDALIPWRDDCPESSPPANHNPGWENFSGGGSCVSWTYGSNSAGYQDVRDQRWQISPDNSASIQSNIENGDASIKVTGNYIDIAQMIKDVNGGIMPAGSYTIHMYTETPWSGEGCAVPNCIISSSPEITKSFTVLPTTDPSCDLIPFPVSLFDFTAQKQGRGSVALAWQTASEQNTSYFLVERSTDGSRYTPLGKVDAAGNSSSKQSYSFLDDKTDSRMARYYYRLKMVDADGTFEYSPVRTILMKEKGASVEVRPNPSNGNVQVLLSNFANKVDLRVANLMGQTVYQTQLDADNYSSDLDLSNLPQGVYFVQATDGVASDVRKVVIEQ